MLRMLFLLTMLTSKALRRRFLQRVGRASGLHAGGHLEAAARIVIVIATGLAMVELYRCARSRSRGGRRRSRSRDFRGPGEGRATDSLARQRWWERRPEPLLPLCPLGERWGQDADSGHWQVPKGLGAPWPWTFLASHGQVIAVRHVIRKSGKCECSVRGAESFGVGALFERFWYRFWYSW